ncbi:MAG: glycine cleavage system aminomethyltransferase GcvT [Rhodothermales bacterium]|nr:glycine cleavage system aminomethyltransferase GcvT [Rhodothermales bacterium]MBO6779856.1 glycine cleavage system aminomethyltransferase GcvT [Rhodothermales bacterium]
MPTDSDTIGKTPLHGVHLELGARMMPFAGFDMPVHYGSIIDEHHAVRQQAGMFDVSHMGEVFVSGPNAEAFIQNLVTNDVTKLDDGKAMYTVMCRPDGGIVDDLLVYRFKEGVYLLVINASNIEGDVAWMRENNEAGAQIDDHSSDIALLAVQGPKAFEIVSEIAGQDLSELPFYRFIRPAPGTFLGCDKVILSHTGYTGEKGLEIYVEAESSRKVWDAVMTAGEKHGLKPAGLGCRDTLRLESGFCLYGNDITLDTNPLEAGLSWLVKFDAGDFVGRDVLLAVKEAGMQRRLVAFVMQERGIPRSGCDIVDADGVVIGRVTSGTQSPTLGQGIGMGYVPNTPEYRSPGSAIGIQVRNRVLQAQVKKAPLHK